MGQKSDSASSISISRTASSGGDIRVPGSSAVARIPEMDENEDSDEDSDDDSEPLEAISRGMLVIVWKETQKSSNLTLF